MSESELIDLIGRVGVEELTPRQCAALRAASRRSEAVRRACQERIALEQNLAHTLGRPAVSIDELLEGRRTVRGGRRLSRWLVLLGLLLVLLGSAVVAGRFGLVDWLAARGPAPELAAAPAEPPPAADPPAAVAAAPTPVAAAPAAAAPPPGPAAAAPPPPADPAPPTAAEPPRGPQPPVAAAAAAVPPGPWERAIADTTKPTEAALFAVPSQPAEHLTVNDLQAWLEPFPGQQAAFENVRVDELATPVELATATGAVRLKCPLVEGTALRLRLPAAASFAVTAWTGTQGGRIEPRAAGKGLAWIGSAVTRRAGSHEPDTRAVVSTSDSRGHLASFPDRELPIVELRYDAGTFILSRGEVRLAEVPLPAPPQEIVFEGRFSTAAKERFVCAGIELVRSVPPPALPGPPPVTQEWQPADLEWQTADPKRLSRDAAGGGVRLVQPDGGPPPAAVALWRLPPAAGGPREIVVGLDAFDPGTGLCLAGPDGKPALVCGFVTPAAGGPPPTAGHQFMVWPPDQSPVQAAASPDAAWLLAPRPIWLRLRACGDRLGLAWSADGRHFATIHPGAGAAPRIRDITAVGVFVGGHAGRGITLSSLAVAELPGLAAILPRPLVPAVDKVVRDAFDPGQFAAWQTEVLAAKPADVDETAWLAAAAIRGLAGNRTGFPWQLCRLAWRHALRQPFTPEQRLAVCDDICRIASTAADAGTNGDRWADVCSGLYGLVAEPCVETGDTAGYLRARLALRQAPLIDPSGFDRDPLRVEERMLKRLVFAGAGVDLARVAARRRFADGQSDLGTWALEEAAARIAADADPVDQGDRWHETQGRWLHPLLVEEPDRAAFSAVTDLRLVLRERAWEDAQRVVEAFVEQSLGVARVGMVRDGGDRARFLSVRQALVDMRREQPECIAHLRAAHAGRGDLRAAQRAAADDALGMEAVAIAFCETPAAAEARAWLGFRNLAAGRFAIARHQFRLGLDAAPEELAARLRAGIRLAEALEGLEPSTPTGALPDVPATDLAETERLLVAARHLGTLGRQVWQFAPAALPPPPGGLDATQRLELESGPRKVPAKPPFPAPRPVALAAGQPPALCDQRIDYGAEVCSLTPVGGRLLVSNRVELCAIETATGRLQWRAGIGQKAGSIASSSLQPMRPAVDGRHAYVRRLTASGPVLAAIRLDDGGVAWEASNRQQSVLASDPVLVDGGLRILEVRKATDLQVWLVAIDAASGRRLFERQLCLLAPTWRAKYPGQRDVPGDGQLATADGLLYAAIAGGVICCDADGGTVWLRRQPWIGPGLDDWWWFQSPCPPLVDEGRLFVAQPGVGGLTAVDAATGRLLWARPLPTLRRLVGMAGGADRRLVVETGDGLFAIDPADGEPRLLLSKKLDAGDPWLGLSATRLLGSGLTTGDGGLIVAVQRPRDAAANAPVFEAAILWIDVAKGTIRHEAAVPALAGSPPFVGPLAAAEGRLWTLFQDNPLELRRTLWELTPAAAR